MSVIWRAAPTQSTGLDLAIAPQALEQLRAAHLARYHARKPILDRLAAIVMLVPGLPLIGFLMVLVKATSKGPAIYKQRRVGRDGKPYTMYKLRSMRVDAEAASGPAWSGEDDPRITPVGRWLRKLHLDELPQLFNVVKGEMSLIGPRPERPEFVEVLAQQIPCYLERLAVLPGVTGLAQINLPADTDLDSVRRKLVLDREYVAKASAWLDLRIIACTALRMVGLSGHFAMRITGLRREVALPSNSVANTPAPHFSASVRMSPSNATASEPEAPPVAFPSPATPVANVPSTAPSSPNSGNLTSSSESDENGARSNPPATVSVSDLARIRDPEPDAEPSFRKRRSNSDSGILDVGSGRPS